MSNKTNSYLQLGMTIGGMYLGSMLGMGGFGIGIGAMAGGYLGAIMFPTKQPKSSMPKISNYPLQQTVKAIPKPILYGTERIAGNIIWAGPPVPYTVKHSSGGGKGGGKGGGGETVEETRYKRSFIIALCEGPAYVRRIWKGKEQIYPKTSDQIFLIITDQIMKADLSSTYADIIGFTWFDGRNNTGISALIGEEFAEYKHDALCLFEDYELGNTEAIPNFVFEVSKFAGYKMTYIAENGGVWGVPFMGTDTLCLDAGGVARNVGGNVVGLPCTGHPFKAGQTISITNSAHYSATYVLLAGTTEDELQFTYSPFTPATFTGAERVVRYTQTGSGSGRLTQDVYGNLYIAQGYTDGTYLVKIDKDGNVINNFFQPIGGWGNTGKLPRAVKVTKDSKYIYMNFADDTRLYKFSLETGLEIWKNTEDTTASYYLDVDDDGNVYLASGTTIGGSSFQTIHKYSADDGHLMQTLYGPAYNPSGSRSPYHILLATILWNGFPIKYAISGGSGSSWNVGGSENLCVFMLDTVFPNGIILGGISEDMDVGLLSNGVPHTSSYTIRTGAICVLNNYIYVRTAKDGGTIHKIKVTFIPPTAGFTIGLMSTGSNARIELEEVKTILCSDAQTLYVDLWGHIVVIKKYDSVTTNIFEIYDQNLALLSSLDGFGSGMFGTITAYAWMTTDAVNWPGYLINAKDEYPPVIIRNLIERFTPLAMNEEAYDTALAYCQTNDIMMSIVLNEQRSLVDWLDCICVHFAGFIYHKNGEIAIGIMREEDSAVDLTRDDIVSEEGESPPPPVRIKKREYNDTYNHIEIVWTNRDADYDIAVAVAKDEVDQRICGHIRKKTIQLAGIHNSTLAMKMAYRILFDSMYRFSIYNFAVSYKNMLVHPGVVGTITDGFLLTDEKLRITSISEHKDGRTLEIEAMEDTTELYPEIAFNGQTSQRTPDEEAVIIGASIAFFEDVNNPALKLCFAPGGADTNGWYIFKSYSADSGFTLLGKATIDEVTGGSANSTGTITQLMPAYPAPVYMGEDTIEVNIGTVTDLASAANDDDFFNNRHLCKIGEEIIAYKTAVETVTEGVWTITGVIRGLFGTEATAHSIGEIFATLDTNFNYIFTPEDIGKTVYFKALTFYGNEIQLIADVTASSYQIQGLYQRPAGAGLLRLTTGETDGGGTEYTGSSFTLYWNLPGQRLTGFNQGGFDLNDTYPIWEYGDSETELVGGSGVSYGNYLADSELQSIDLVFETTAGVAIGQRSVAATSESEVIDKTADLGGNDTAVIKVIPRRSLRSITESEIEVVNV